MRVARLRTPNLEIDMAQVIECRDPKKWEPDFSDLKSYFVRVDAELEKLREVSRKVDLEKTVVDVLLQFSVADGHAVYRVVDDKRLTLEHIPIGDAYHADHRLLRGLRVEEIREDEKNARDVAAIFTKKR